jgi:transketolase
VVAAAARLREEDVHVAVYSMHTVKPLDTVLLDALFTHHAVVFSVEEHSRVGGLGSALLEYCNDARLDARKLYRIGTSDGFIHETGDQAYARKLTGIDSEQLYQTLTNKLKETHTPIH